MPWWYYDKKELRSTPSIVKDGMDYEVECQYRKEGARFIIETGNKMDLGYNTMATGVVYFHRFYMVHSFSSFPKYVRISIFALNICDFIALILMSRAVNGLLRSVPGRKSRRNTEEGERHHQNGREEFTGCRIRQIWRGS